MGNGANAGRNKLMGRRPRPARGFWAPVLASALALSGCATQPAYQRPALAIAPAWANALSAGPDQTAAPAAADSWWTALHDPAIDALTAAAFAGNPTLAEAVATEDQARATFAEAGAARLPSVSATGSASIASMANLAATSGLSTGTGLQSGGTSATLLEDTASIGPSLSWELDLWGRLRDTAQAANDRLLARGADADGARLSLAAEVAGGVLSLRACDYSLAVRDQDIASRATELNLMNQRLAFGNVAPADVADAATNLASARTDRISQEEQCRLDVDALVTLSGRDAAGVRELVARQLTGAAAVAARASGPSGGAVAPPPMVEVDVAAIMPAPPPLRPALPAAVLLRHPSVISAEREAAARWSEIGEARADRLPQIDLSALLTGNWLSATGTSLIYQTWSAGLSLSAPLFDGGSGAAKVRGAQASYRAAVAALRATLRTAAQNVEDALAVQQSAEQRMVTSRQAVDAGWQTLRADEARWRAGSISLFDLEDARRQFNSAQESAIAAARDRAQAWVDLVEATGSGSAVDNPPGRDAGTPIANARESHAG